MTVNEELRGLLACFERLAGYTTDTERRQTLLQIAADIRMMLAEQENSAANMDLFNSIAISADQTMPLPDPRSGRPAPPTRY